MALNISLKQVCYLLHLHRRMTAWLQTLIRSLRSFKWSRPLCDLVTPLVRIKNEWRKCRSEWTPSRRWRRASACWASCWRATARRAVPRATRSSLRFLGHAAHFKELLQVSYSQQVLLSRCALLVFQDVSRCRIFTIDVRRWGPRCSD